MSKHPFVNALVASGYISLLVTGIMNSPKLVTDNELGMMAPVLFLSLFVLSAALMGYFFLYQPIQFLVEGKKEEATKLFLTTVFAFACITGVMVLSWLLLSGVF
jgi:heme O synthase-like polyprenyltransferase